MGNSCYNSILRWRNATVSFQKRGKIIGRQNVHMRFGYQLAEKIVIMTLQKGKINEN
jgi:hypothetical protein